MKMLHSAATQSKPAALCVLRNIPCMLTRTPAWTSHTAAQDVAFAFAGVESLDVTKIGGVVKEKKKKYLRPAADSSSILSLLKHRVDANASPRISATQKAPSVRATNNGLSAKKKQEAWNAPFIDFVDSLEEPSMGGV